MSPDAPTEFQQWLDVRFKDLSEDLRKTRHDQRDDLNNLALEVRTLVLASKHSDAQVRQHDVDIAHIKDWKNKMAGAVGVLIFLFPTTVGAIVAVFLAKGQ